MSAPINHMQGAGRKSGGYTRLNQLLPFLSQQARKPPSGFPLNPGPQQAHARSLPKHPRSPTQAVSYNAPLPTSPFYLVVLASSLTWGIDSYLMIKTSSSGSIEAEKQDTSLRKTAPHQLHPLSLISGL